MQKIKHIVYIIIVIIIVALGISKFEYRIEIEELELVMMMGLDSNIGENNQVELTYLRNPIEKQDSSGDTKGQSTEKMDKQSGNQIEGQNNSSDSQSSQTDRESAGQASSDQGGNDQGAASPENKENILTVKDRTYNRALKVTQRFSDKVIVGDSVKYYIIGEDTAKNGILKEVDFLSRNYELRLDSKIFIAKDMSAKELLSKADIHLYKRLDNIIDSTVQMPYVRETSLVNVLKSFSSPNKAEVIPVLEVTDITGTEEINIIGLALFKYDKLIRYLSDEEVRNYSLLTSDLKAVSIDINDETFGNVAIGITTLNKKLDFEFDNNTLKKIKYKIHFFGNIEEMDYNQDLYDHNAIGRFEEEAAQSIYIGLNQIANICKENKADFLRISDTVASKYPKEWKNLQSNWDEVIAHADFEFTIDSTIARTYDVTDSSGD